LLMMPAASVPYEVDNGELFQTVVEGSVATCYVRVSLPASSTTAVTISPSSDTGVPEAGGATLALVSPPSPNPTRGRAALSFSIPSRARVRAEILTVQGRRAALLCDETLDPGEHTVEWRPDADAAGLSSGVYLYRVESSGRTLTGKIVLLR